MATARANTKTETITSAINLKLTLGEARALRALLGRTATGEKEVGSAIYNIYDALADTVQGMLPCNVDSYKVPDIDLHELV